VGKIEEEKTRKLMKQLERVELNKPLAKYTTLRIGGPAQFFYEAKTVDELIKSVNLARDLGIKVTILGGGSNVLISDKGIKGLVVRNCTKNIKILEKIKEYCDYTFPESESESRWKPVKAKGGKVSLDDLDYDERGKPRVGVVLDSGVPLPFAIEFLIKNQITGLQWFTGIPGTIGGAVYNNIHGGKHFFSEVVKSVEILGLNGKVATLESKDLEFGYNKSRFHYSKEVILRVELSLYKGDVERAKYVCEKIKGIKKDLPLNSAGCVFSNITEGEAKRLGVPTQSTGYLIENVLKLTGFKIGDAAISKIHHNFIVNQGHATARQFLGVMKKIYVEAQKVGIKLKPEIVLLGFSKDEIIEFL